MMIEMYSCLLANSNIDPNELTVALNDGMVPNISYQLLGLAMALASFLPALLYSYAKDFLDERDGINDINAYKKYKNNAIGFVYSIDIILTQSIIFVLFSILYSIIVFLGTTMKNCESFFCDKTTVKIILFINFWHFIALFFSDKQMDGMFLDIKQYNKKYKTNITQDKSNKWDIIRNIKCQNIEGLIIWKGGKCYLITWWWVSIIIAFLIELCACAILIFAKEWIYIILLSWITFCLFSAALIWFFPLFTYRPLGNLLENIFSRETKPENAKIGTWKLKKDDGDGSAIFTIKLIPKDDGPKK